MKKTLIALGTTATLLASVMAPASSFAAPVTQETQRLINLAGPSCYNSGDWDFSIDYGGSGDETTPQALCKGKLKVTGSITGQKHEGETSNSYSSVTVYVKQEVWGRDKTITSFKVDLKNGRETDISVSVGSVELGNYYLDIVPNSPQGEYWSYEGSGSFSIK
ncbi:hypothetical protein [Paenibacillus elgii]|uniref:hypothetical protein n=1 Tax=Paenibacillus elgii TaxID=189691 RepID=UPI001111A258|nr:hypothetical protein [Paenibacillus elgii]